MQDIEDAVLVERCVKGQRDAFETLVARYWERIHVMIAHSKPVGLAAEDVVQEAFIQAYRKLATLRDPGRFAGWLYRIALRISRARRGGATVPLSEATARADDGSDPRASQDALDTRAHVRAAVASLPDLYRAVVTLRFFDEMSC
ncbi:MAG: sigma-70 family RNA polymerase sigma factor, partial [Planctomycetota bacterium]